MTELEELKQRLASERPVPWTEFPDIGLYKDQVVTYLQRQLIDFGNDGPVTPAMINNYIKDKLIPRADGKKYSREHLAGLTEISFLKQVLQVRDIGLLLSEELKEDGSEEFYMKCRQLLDDELRITAEQIDPEWESEELSDMALKLAVSSYCKKLACERLLEIIRLKKLPGERKDTERKPGHRHE